MTRSVEALEAAVQQMAESGEETRERVDLLVELAAALGTNDPQRVLALSREACGLARRLGYTSGEAYALGYMGFAYYMVSDHETAYEKLSAALRLSQTEGNRNAQALVFSALAGVQMSLGQYEQSLASGIQALKLFREMGNRREEAWTLNGFGNGYTDFGAYDRALRFYRDALAIFEALGEEPVGLARALNGIGTVYLRQGRYEEALPYHTRSLEHFGAAGNRIGEARALDDLGLVYQHLGDLDRALDFHRRSLAIREEIGNRQSQSTSLINMGHVFLSQDDVEMALDVLHRALAIAEEVGARPRAYQAHQALADAYERRGDMAGALGHFKAYHRLREAVMGEEQQAAVNNLRVGFEVEKTEREAELTRQRNAELREKNEQLERLLAELKAAQDQLVQQEKMASLGQLTAGIAHEIKNPLNFVNNFAQLSAELVDELKDELNVNREQPIDAVLDDVADLLDDLRFNAEKINEHGRRADGIVRAMLQHARRTPGERQATDLNVLLEEYVGLAYHGMRAATPGFNVTIECDYDAGVGDVDLVPQEIGRVLLNLLNNAFYAVHRRAMQTDGPYTPTVKVSTHRAAGNVVVRIADNGPGIPKDLRQKIFEPFFTTKPTGEGTGLGLSLSYDIVTRGHGGTLSVAGEEGQGATFIVALAVDPKLPAR